MGKASLKRSFFGVVDKSWPHILTGNWWLLDNTWFLLFVFVLFFSHFLLSVFPEDSDAAYKAHHPYKHTHNTARLAGSHGGCLPHESTNHDDHGTHAFPLSTGCTVLHPTGSTDLLNGVLMFSVCIFHSSSSGYVCAQKDIPRNLRKSQANCFPFWQSLC